MAELTRLSVDDFLDRLADRTPTPGGGGVSGLAGALACALGRMVAAYSVGKKTDPAVTEKVQALTARLHRADQLLRALITQDATAYSDMTVLGKDAREHPERRATYQDAVLKAVAVPMEMAALASSALATMDELKEMANRYLLSDLAIAAVLADAAARTARYTVQVNLGELDDEGARQRIKSDIDRTVAHGEQHRDAIETFVRDALEPGSAANR